MTEPASARQRILAAAERLLARGDLASVAAVAREAGVSRRTVYRQVGTRDALRTALAARGHHDEDVRLRLVRAARDVVGRDGLHGATLEAVARAAGVGIATLYRHFGTRERLVQAVIDDVRATTGDPVAPATGASLDARLRALLLPTVAVVVREAPLLRQVVALGPASALAPLARGPGRTVDKLADVLGGAVATGELRPVDPREAAWAIVSLVLGYTAFAPSLHGVAIDDPEHVVDTVLQLVLDGLRTR